MTDQMPFQQNVTVCSAESVHRHNKLRVKSRAFRELFEDDVEDGLTAHLVSPVGKRASRQITGQANAR